MKYFVCDDNPSHSASEGWDDGDGASGQGGEYPPGEHPLEGVANLEDLAEPEALSAKVDLSEVSCVLGALGVGRELATPSLAIGSHMHIRRSRAFLRALDVHSCENRQIYIFPSGIHLYANHCTQRFFGMLGLVVKSYVSVHRFENVFERNTRVQALRLQ